MDRDLRVASPCSADWERMVGDDRVRYCGECKLSVYNFSAMTAEEVERLVVSHEGRLCGRLYQRPDGTVLTRDCPVGFRAVVRRISRVAGAALSAAMSMSFATAQTSEQESPSLVQIEQSKAGIALVVTDQSGAVIPNARVLLVDEASHRQLAGRTDSLGKLRLTNLTTGSYALTVEFPGFRTARQVVATSPREITEVQLTLEVGATMGEIVEVQVSPLEMEAIPEFVPEESSQLDALPTAPSPQPRRQNFFKKLVSPFGR